MADEATVELFRRSLLGVPAALNAYRAEHGQEPLEPSRILNFNAYDHAGHLMKAGMADPAAIQDTVRPFEGQDLSDAVELVRQWPVIKEADEYLFPWTRDGIAQSVLLGEYGFVGVAGQIITLDSEARPFYKAIVVMVLTKTQPRR
jgi:hypothetical protein